MDEPEQPSGDQPEQPKSAEDAFKEAQDKASDPDNARKWRKAASQIDQAMQSLVGGATNLFFGNTQFGDGNLQTSTHHLGVVVRSGPVPATVLERIRESYVEPSGYRAIKEKLESGQLVVMRARRGTGRTTTALRLLDHLCREGVRKLDPDANLKALKESDFEEYHGYLLESFEPEQALEFRGFHAEHLAGLMEGKGCCLVIIVDEAVPLRLNDIRHLVVDDLGVVEPERLLRKHLAWYGTGEELLARTEVREIVADVPGDTPCRELAELGDLLVDVARGRIEPADVRERFSRTSAKSFADWFAEQAETDQRAFVISLAVFNNGPAQVVSDAAAALAELIRVEEIPKQEDRARSLFATTLGRRLDGARAELRTDVEETVFGKVPVQVARFRDDRFPIRVLRHLCAEYDQALPVIREWLCALGGIRAGVAAGLLSLHDFASVYDEIIEPWADSGEEGKRWAAVAALQVPGETPEFARVVCKLLNNWIRGDNYPRKITALQTLGSTTAMSPAAVLTQLRYAARHADWTIAVTIGESITELYVRVDDPGQVLRALVKWTDEDEHPKRRESALLAVLIVSGYVESGPDKWPGLIWAAEHEHRALVLVLLSRMLQTANFLHGGYEEIRRWVRRAQKDAALREPLARLLLDVGEKSDELDTIRFYVERWAEERNGPVDAAKAVLWYFDHGKGVPCPMP